MTTDSANPLGGWARPPIWEAQHQPPVRPRAGAGTLPPESGSRFGCPEGLHLPRRVRPPVLPRRRPRRRPETMRLAVDMATRRHPLRDAPAPTPTPSSSACAPRDLAHQPARSAHNPRLQQTTSSEPRRWSPRFIELVRRHAAGPLGPTTTVARPPRQAAGSRPRRVLEVVERT